MKVRAPAEAARITEFIRGSEKRYVAALGEVKSRLLAAKQSNSELSCIYSIYRSKVLLGTTGHDMKFSRPGPT